jgi:hypothetical protein
LPSTAGHGAHEGVCRPRIPVSIAGGTCYPLPRRVPPCPAGLAGFRQERIPDGAESCQGFAARSGFRRSRGLLRYVDSYFPPPRLRVVRFMIWKSPLFWQRSPCRLTALDIMAIYLEFYLYIRPVQKDFPKSGAAWGRRGRLPLTIHLEFRLHIKRQKSRAICLLIFQEIQKYFYGKWLRIYQKDIIAIRIKIFRNPEKRWGRRGETVTQIIKACL